MNMQRSFKEAMEQIDLASMVIPQRLLSCLPIFDWNYIYEQMRQQKHVWQ